LSTLRAVMGTWIFWPFRTLGRAESKRTHATSGPRRRTECCHGPSPSYRRTASEAV
jgi:hypothetical protein